MFPETSESNREDVFLRVEERPFILYVAKVKDLQGGVYDYGINDVPFLIPLHLNPRHFPSVWLHETVLLLESTSRPRFEIGGVCWLLGLFHHFRLLLVLLIEVAYFLNAFHCYFRLYIHVYKAIFLVATQLLQEIESIKRD